MIEFGLDEDMFEIKHIALTDEQIRQYNPPPNPAKFSDPRAKWYVEKYGKTSWEVDALNPKVLNQIVTREINNIIDMDLFEEQIRQEDNDKEKLKKFMEKVK